MLDKGKSASITTLVETSDKDTGRVIFESMSTVIIRGSGGFGGKKKGSGKNIADERASFVYTDGLKLIRRPRTSDGSEQPSQTSARRDCGGEDVASASGVISVRRERLCVFDANPWTLKFVSAHFSLSGDINPLHVCRPPCQPCPTIRLTPPSRSSPNSLPWVALTNLFCTVCL